MAPENPEPGTRTPKLPIGFLVSGRGSNLQAVIDAIARGEVDAEIRLVISNHPGVPALERAAEAGIETCTITAQGLPSRREQQMEMARLLEEHGVELVVLGGFDRIVVPELIERFPLRMINIHPSLLPAFANTLHGQREALEYGVKVAGCTVHIVTTDVDAGPILAQAWVPVEEDDTEETLAARILGQEHRILPRAVQLFAQRRVRVEGRRAVIGPPQPT